LEDVARAAGVDRSTASRVLNRQPLRIRDEKRALIEQVAADLGYHPSSAARGLRRRQIGALGLLIPDFANPVYASIMRAAALRAEELGYAMLMGEILPSDRDSSGPVLRRLVREQRIDGLIIATAQNSDGLLAELQRVRVPHVLAHRRTPKAKHSVVLDDEGAAALAAEYLVARGHTELGVIVGPLGIDTSQRRLAGFLGRCERLGVPKPIVVSEEFTARGGFDGMASLVGTSPRPSAVFVSNLLACAGALAALHARGIRVPQEMSLISYDDDDLANYMIPPLTTIAVPYDELGRVAVETIDAVLRGDNPGNTIVTTPPRIVERQSVAARH
jgi:DNA-binding LacI/PurR family transcriptional regulator